VTHALLRQNPRARRSSASYAGEVTIALRLLGEVSFDGELIAGARSADILAALALHRSGLSDARLLDEVWADLAPTTKALQVQVSRVRAQCGPNVIERYDTGYRLGLAEDEVDVWVLESLAEAARKALVDDPQQAAASAVAAGDLVRGLTPSDGEGPLAEVRRQARALLPALARSHALALTRCGHDAEAVEALQRAHAWDPDDTEVLEALLRAEASTVGPPAALARYETYRADLAERLGVDPDPVLKRMHRELLVADEPVRTGVL